MNSHKGRRRFKNQQTTNIVYDKEINENMLNALMLFINSAYFYDFLFWRILVCFANWMNFIHFLFTGEKPRLFVFVHKLKGH